VLFFPYLLILTPKGRSFAEKEKNREIKEGETKEEREALASSSSSSKGNTEDILRRPLLPSFLALTTFCHSRERDRAKWDGWGVPARYLISISSWW